MSWKEEIKKQSRLADYDIDRLQRVIAIINNLMQDSEVKTSTKRSLRKIGELINLVMNQTKE